MTSGAEVVVAAGKGLAAVGMLAKSSPFIVKHAKRTFRRVVKGSVSVPVFGAGGAGKSTLGRILAGVDAIDSDRSYNESLWTEIVPLQGDIPGVIKVAPGQIARIDRHWPHLFSEISNKKSSGIINVVAYGYHALGLPSIRSTDLWKDGMDIETFRDLYLAKRRAHEIELIQHLMNGLSAVTSPMWMVTVINKQDLWYLEQEAVESHYREGPYYAAIQGLEHRLGRGAFQHEFLPVSLTMNNLGSQSGEVIAPVAAGYDENRRDKSLIDLSDKIRLLVEK